jgi:hypothetical protein
MVPAPPMPPITASDTTPANRTMTANTLSRAKDRFDGINSSISLIKSYPKRKEKNGIAIPVVTSTNVFPLCMNEYTHEEKVVKEPQNPTVSPVNIYGLALLKSSNPTSTPMTKDPRKFTVIYGDSGKN